MRQQEPKPPANGEGWRSRSMSYRIFLSRILMKDQPSCYFSRISSTTLPNKENRGFWGFQLFCVPPLSLTSPLCWYITFVDDDFCPVTNKGVGGVWVKVNIWEFLNACCLKLPMWYTINESFMIHMLTLNIEGKNWILNGRKSLFYQWSPLKENIAIGWKWVVGLWFLSLDVQKIYHIGVYSRIEGNTWW